MCKIAICDDDKEYREKIKTVIETEGILSSNEIRFYEYESGKELLEDADILHDLIFMDMRMPGLDGNKMIEWIIPNAQKNSMEPVRLTLKPGGSSDTHLPHAGEEFGYVLKGTVRVFYGGKTYTVRAGESFYFQAGKKHRLENNGNRDAILIWVSTPPSF